MENIFEGKGMIINNLRHLTAKEAFECCQNDAIIIDVREEFMSSMKTFDVPEIKVFPLKKLSETVNKLPKDKYLIFADATGVKSKPAMEFAYKEGYTNIANLAGGLVEWDRDGMPVITYKNLLVSSRNKCEFVNKNISKDNYI